MGTPDHLQRKQFDAFVAEHHVRLRAFVRSLGVEPDWVDDVAQEAFLTAYRDWDSFAEARNPGQWVRGIAANIVRNELRKKARRQRILNGELAEILLKRHSESDDRAEPGTVEAIRHCMTQLDAPDRQLVQVRYGQGISGTQLAEVMNLSAANVRQKLSRIRMRLKRCVELRLRAEG